MGQANRAETGGVEHLQRVAVRVERLGALKVQFDREGAVGNTLLDLGGGPDDLDLTF
ncbi:MAG: hypothetical protein R2849_18730 [Thermomicrobiales bacterium]